MNVGKTEYKLVCMVVDTFTYTHAHTQTNTNTHTHRYTCVKVSKTFSTLSICF